MEDDTYGPRPKTSSSLNRKPKQRDDVIETKIASRTNRNKLLEISNTDSHSKDKSKSSGSYSTTKSAGESLSYSSSSAGDAPAPSAPMMYKKKSAEPMSEFGRQTATLEASFGMNIKEQNISSEKTEAENEKEKKKSEKREEEKDLLDLMDEIEM